MQNFINITTDVYGEVPAEVVNLCYVALIKNVCKHLPIRKMWIKFKEVKIEFNTLNLALTQAINSGVEKFKNNMVINLSNMPIITLNNYNGLPQAFTLINNFVKSVNL